MPKSPLLLHQQPLCPSQTGSAMQTCWRLGLHTCEGFALCHTSLAYSVYCWVSPHKEIIHCRNNPMDLCNHFQDWTTNKSHISRRRFYFLPFCVSCILDEWAWHNLGLHYSGCRNISPVILPLWRFSSSSNSPLCPFATPHSEISTLERNFSVYYP